MGIEAPDTRLGQLQRGLGRGFLAALRGSRGTEDLLDCIADDPRWDRQLEQRAAYYAELAVELEAPVAPIATAMAGDAPGYLAANVLKEMAVRGREDALGALRDGLGHSLWLTALRAFESAEQEHEGLLVRPEDLAVVAEREPDEPRRAFANTRLPWRRWARDAPKLRRLLEDASTAPGPARRRRRLASRTPR